MGAPDSVVCHGVNGLFLANEAVNPAHESETGHKHNITSPHAHTSCLFTRVCMRKSQAETLHTGTVGGWYFPFGHEVTYIGTM